MILVLECWEGCSSEVPFEAPVTRGSEELIDGVAVECPECGQKYTLTVDGDGEAELVSLDDESMGDVINDPESTHY